MEILRIILGVYIHELELLKNKKTSLFSLQRQWSNGYILLAGEGVFNIAHKGHSQRPCLDSTRFSLFIIEVERICS